MFLGLSANEWVGIVGIIVNVVVAIFIGIQARACRKSDKKEGFENSFRMTYFYIKEIIPEMDYLGMVYLPIIENMKEYREMLKGATLEEFDKQGFESLYKGLTLQEFERKVREKCDMFGKHFGEECTFTGGEVIAKILSLLNKMEYFAMYFNSGVASSDVIYESLHQTFLEWVGLLYPFICRSNDRTTPEKTYYNNTVKLYKDWRKKEEEYAKELSLVRARVNCIEEQNKKL